VPGWNEQGIVTEAVEWVESEERIDVAALQARDPILFFDEVIFWIFCPKRGQQDLRWLTYSNPF